MNTPMSPLYPIIRYVLPVLVAAIMLVQLGCSDRGQAAVADSTEAVTVRAAPVESLWSGQSLRFAGTVRPRQRASLTFQMGGVLRQRDVELGESVTKGQELALLYHPEITPARDAAAARLRELQANTEQTRRDRKRSRELAERGVISRQELEQQEARLEALEAAVASAAASLAQAERMTEEMLLRAPFSGSIEALMVEPGEYVAAGQTVMRLAAAEGQEVEVRVPASLLRELTVGDRLPVSDSFSGAEWSGHIIEVGRSAIEGRVLYPLVVGIDSREVSAGDAVEVSLQRQRMEGLGIPLAAVMRSGEGLAVFRVTADERVERVGIEVSGIQGDRVLLAPGALVAGDAVVYDGLTRLAAGDRVRRLP